MNYIVFLKNGQDTVVYHVDSVDRDSSIITMLSVSGNILFLANISEIQYIRQY